jgi:16S rRNA (guanine(966)-N(2))-methyltransferase RsmD
MRVIAGKFRSRQLKSLRGMALRPTSDRLRETLFNVIADRVEGSRFLDVFAGTGAVGIEALSRGAREVLFIENHGPAAALIEKNLESLGLRAEARVVALDALRGLQRLAGEAAAKPKDYDIVFLDPPYAAAENYRGVLMFLGASSLLSEGSLVIAEHQRKFELPETAGKLERMRVLRQGEAALSFYRCTIKKLADGATAEKT